MLEKEQPDASEFEHLHGQLLKLEKNISPVDLQTFYTYLRNILTILYNTGKLNVLPILFEYQKAHFQRGYLHYEGKISATAFISLVINGLKTKWQFDWVEKFINNQKGHILQDSENDYFNLARAMFCFAKREYEMTLEILPQSLKDLDYQFIAKRIELKVYYETNSELLSYKIDAFKMFISRASQKLISPC